MGVFEKGRLGQWVVEERPATPLGTGEVRVEIRVAGLNFRDVLNVLGMVSNPWLGLELAGVVTEVGLGWSRFKSGRECLALERNLRFIGGGRCSIGDADTDSCVR